MVESLEGRNMFAATMPAGFVSPTPEYVDGTVVVMGTKYDDSFTISFNSDGIGIDVNVNGSVTTFFRSLVKSISVDGGKGKDSVKVVDTVEQPMVVSVVFFGGQGNDVMTSGSGNDTFVSGPGKDTLVNASSTDTMFKNRGPKSLVV